jgi:outer membrane protein assembly factor BamA
LDLDEAPALDRALVRTGQFPAIRIFGEGFNGFRAKLGQPIPTSGFTIGPEYVRHDLRDGRMMVRTSARVSQQRYLLMDGEVAIPRLGQRGFLNVLGTYRQFPRLHYFGQGPNSREEDFTIYRLEDVGAEATAGYRLSEKVRIGGTGGYLAVNTGPGFREGVPSIETRYNEFSAPGVTRQTDFLTGGGFVEYDSTDVYGSPRTGGTYSARLNHYSDRVLERHSFRRLDFDVRRYFPFFSSQRLIAVRAYSAMTQGMSGDRVPFYLQPTLGGADMLRGYGTFRFHDNNLMFFNAEYRWKVSSGLELAMFADAGQVAPRVRDFDLRELKTSYGIGLRANSRRNVFARVDLGCGKEGCQVWLRFNNIF